MVQETGVAGEKHHLTSSHCQDSNADSSERQAAVSGNYVHHMAIRAGPRKVWFNYKQRRMSNRFSAVYMYMVQWGVFKV